MADRQRGPRFRRQMEGQVKKKLPQPGSPEWLSAKSTGPRWQWEDAQGVTRQGYMEKVIDRGGNDVTYFMRHADTGALNVIRGSLTKKMKIVETPK